MYIGNAFYNGNVEYTNITLKLLCPDTSNYLVSYINRPSIEKFTIDAKNQLTELTFPFEYPIDIASSATWHVSVGSPDLSDIRGIEIEFEDLHDYWYPPIVYVAIDGFHFYGGQFTATVDHSDGSPYGARCAVPIENTDLNSDAECETFANSELAKIEDPIETIEGVLVEGNNDFYPAYKQSIPLENGTTKTYILAEIVDRLQGTHWDSELKLFREVS